MWGRWNPAGTWKTRATVPVVREAMGGHHAHLSGRHGPCGDAGRLVPVVREAMGGHHAISPGDTARKQPSDLKPREEEAASRDSERAGQLDIDSDGLDVRCVHAIARTSAYLFAIAVAGTLVCLLASASMLSSFSSVIDFMGMILGLQSTSLRLPFSE